MLGGVVPKLVFLSACHSGAFLTVAEESEITKSTGMKDLPDSITNKQGYTSTALLTAGVSQVVAMRDGYARQLSIDSTANYGDKRINLINQRKYNK